MNRIKKILLHPSVGYVLIGAALLFTSYEKMNGVQSNAESQFFTGILLASGIALLGAVYKRKK